MKQVVTKHPSEKKLVLERITLDMRYVLTLEDDKCIGCGICETTCPEQALELSPPVTRNGRLIQKPDIDFVPGKCTFCGECIDLCPTNAITIEINGEKRIPILEVEAFPTLRKLVAIDARRCWYGAITATCDVTCQKECPRDAIDVTVENAVEGSVGRIVDFKVLEEACIFCKKCEKACPEDAIKVINPIGGSLQLDTSLCPEECQICADICPSEAIILNEDKKLVITEEFCIYCGACQQVCPEKAIEVTRTQILHSDVQSGAWVIALEKLASYGIVSKEMNTRSGKRRHARVKSLSSLQRR